MRISRKNGHSRRSEGAERTPSHRPQKAYTSLSLSSFPKSSRILRRQRFKEIASARNRYFGKFLTIDFVPAASAKIGITVVRQFGNAVKRNRFKRLVRESFRHSQRQPFEIIVMPKKGLEDYSLEQIKQDLLEFSDVAQSRAAKSS